MKKKVLSGLLFTYILTGFIFDLPILPLDLPYEFDM